MKKLSLLIITLCMAYFTYTQTATNFTVNDCSGVQHDLFSELEAGKIIALCWVMPCVTCTGPAKTTYNVVNSYQTSNPNRVLFYLLDDYANSSCNDIKTFGSGVGTSIPVIFVNPAIKMTDYGSTGMPKVVILGGAEHKVLYNANNTVDYTSMQNAINTALQSLNITLPAKNISCGNQPIPFTTEPVLGGTPPYTLSWSTQDGITTNGNSVTFAPTVTTTYALTVTDNAGASKTGTMVYELKKKIVPDFTYQFNYNSPLTVTFTNTSQNTTSGPGSTDVYTWSFKQGTSSQGTSSVKDPVFKFKNTGTFTVLLLTTNECGQTSVSKTIMVTSMDELENTLTSKVNFQTNPVDKNATLSFTVNKPIALNIELFNTIGKRMKTVYSGSVPQGKNTIEFNTSELSNGLYFIKMNPGYGKMMKMMVVH